MARQTSLRALMMGMGTTAVGFAVGLNSECGMGQWVGAYVTAKEQGRVSGWKITKRKHQESGGFWLN